MSNLITVWFVNASGNGFAEKVEIPQGCTVEDLFKRQIGQMEAPQGYTIILMRGSAVYGGSASANSYPLDKHFPLQDGDRVSMVATSLKGA